MNTRRSSAASARACAAASASVSPSSTTRAPQAAVRVTLVDGVKAGMTMVAAIPSSWACRATAWAWLPADMAMTPRRRSSALSNASRFAAPRSLKAPVACRLSSLSVDLGARGARERVGGQGRGAQTPAMRAAAASTSASAKPLLCDTYR